MKTSWTHKTYLILAVHLLQADDVRIRILQDGEERLRPWGEPPRWTNPLIDSETTAISVPNLGGTFLGHPSDDPSDDPSDCHGTFFLSEVAWERGDARHLEKRIRRC